MSVSTEISRIQTSRNTIRAKLVSMGMATNTATLDTLAAIIDDLIDQGAVSVTVREGETYTIPKGYHNGSGTVSGVAGGGSYTLQSKSATPTKKQQNITPDAGYYGLSDVTILAIPDAYQDVSNVNVAAEEVLTGKIFVTAAGVVTAGTMTNNGAVSVTLDGTTVSYTIPKGFHDGKGSVKIVLESKTVTPTKETQEVTPTAGKLLEKVTVNPIPGQYHDTSDADVASGTMLAGTVGYGKNGRVVGSIPSNGAMNKTIDGITVTSVEIPAGHTTGGTVSLTNDIEEALAAI